jgi:hypothetical protein
VHVCKLLNSLDWERMRKGATPFRWTAGDHETEGASRCGSVKGMTGCGAEERCHVSGEATSKKMKRQRAGANRNFWSGGRI